GASPVYSFAGDLTTGFSSPGANNIGLVLGGTEYIDFTAARSQYNHAIVMNQSLIEEAQSVNIAAAANIDLAAATGNYVYVTNAAGVVNITRLGGVNLPKGTRIEIKFVITGGSVTIKTDPVFLAL